MVRFLNRSHRREPIARTTSDFKRDEISCSIQQYPTVDFLLSSHYVSSWKCTNPVVRDLLLVTPGNVKVHLSITSRITEFQFIVY